MLPIILLKIVNQVCVLYMYMYVPRNISHITLHVYVQMDIYMHNMCEERGIDCCFDKKSFGLRQ